MKNSYEIVKELGVTEYEDIIHHDMKEIDNPNLHHPRRLNYLDRIEKCIHIVQQKFPNPDGIIVGDFACAQGNIGLILAELGYDVWAIDINPKFIEYSQKKYQKGKIKWLVGEVSKLDMKFNFLDMAIAGELIEHCAYPEEIVKQILSYVRVGGYLILTTPNGSKIGGNLPTFSEVLKSNHAEYEAKQFGPDAKDHLFLFTLDEIKQIIPENAEIENCGYCGGTLLFNKYTILPMRLIPIKFLIKFSKSIMTLPYLKNKLSSNIYAIIKKGSE